MAKKAAKTVGEFDCPVQFGGVSIGDETARIGVKINRSTMKIGLADKYFAGSRLAIDIERYSENEGEGQKLLVDGARTTLGATVDVKGFKSTRKAFGISSTFSLGSIDVRDLAKFSKAHGTLSISASEKLPDDKGKEPDEESDE